MILPAALSDEPVPIGFLFIVNQPNIVDGVMAYKFSLPGGKQSGLIFLKVMDGTAVPPTKFLIWNFYNDLRAVRFIRVFQYELPVMLLDNTMCNIKPHTKMQIRSPAMVAHKKLLLCMI